MPDDEVLARLAAKMNVGEWIAAERRYADAKWDQGENREVAMQHTRDDPTGEWVADYARQYLHRASIFGMDTPQGRQQLGKAVVTLIHGLERVWQVYGPLPEPGHPSGEIA